MLNHRFRDVLESHAFPDRLAAAPDQVAFVPCPCFASMTGTQQAQILEIYRIAAERTQAQLRPARRSIPEFSLN